MVVASGEPGSGRRTGRRGRRSERGLLELERRLLGKEAMFKNRIEAGRMLLAKLRAYAGHAPIVLAVNRGGVAVAQPIARFLRAPVDVFLTRPVYTDGGLLLGSVAMGGGTSLEAGLLRSTGLAPTELAEKTERARRALQAPAAALRGDRPLPEVLERIVIVVSDGLGPVHDMIAVLRSVRARSPHWLAVAAPFFTRAVARRLADEADLVVALTIGEPPGSIYEDLHHADDEETHLTLSESHTAP